MGFHCKVRCTALPPLTHHDLTFCFSVCITVWAGGASLLILGLSVPHIMGVMIIARVLISSFVIANGWLGAEWHIGFTVAQRYVRFASCADPRPLTLLRRLIFGVYGSYIGILIRIMLSIIWYASQAWLGGLCVAVMLSSWSHSFLTMGNTLPESAHMVTRDLIGFTIFQLISLPLLVGFSSSSGTHASLTTAC